MLKHCVLYQVRELLLNTKHSTNTANSTDSCIRSQNTCSTHLRFSIIPWARHVAGNIARVVVIDADLYPLKEDAAKVAATSWAEDGKDPFKDPLKDDTEAAMDLVGDNGCVIIIFSASSFASSSRAIAAEQGRHGKTM